MAWIVSYYFDRLEDGAGNFCLVFYASLLHDCIDGPFFSGNIFRRYIGKDMRQHIIPALRAGANIITQSKRTV